MQTILVAKVNFPALFFSEVFLPLPMANLRCLPLGRHGEASFVLQGQYGNIASHSSSQSSVPLPCTVLSSSELLISQRLRPETRSHALLFSFFHGIFFCVSLKLYIKSVTAASSSAPRLALPRHLSPDL